MKKMLLTFALMVFSSGAFASGNQIYHYSCWASLPGANPQTSEVTFVVSPNNSVQPSNKIPLFTLNGISYFAFMTVTNDPNGRSFELIAKDAASGGLIATAISSFSQSSDAPELSLAQGQIFASCSVVK